MADTLMERIVPWTVNGAAQHAFLCTPEHLDELALGHLLAQGMIEDAADVKFIAETPASPEEQAMGIAARVAVTLAEGATLHHPDILTRLTACPPCESGFTIARADLLNLCARLLADEDYYGAHRLMLHAGDREAFREDAGRHNAADKLIAWAVREGVDLHHAVLGATGRISLEMLAKAAQLGVPVFFSRKYPSDIAIQWAEKLNIALVSRAHREDMTVHGATWRVQ